MKKLIIALVLLISPLMFISAQGKQKDVVYVENFTYSSEIGTAYVEALRNKVIAAMVKTDRIIVKDVNSEASLKDQERRVTEDASAVDGSMLNQMKNLQANYVIQGHITTVEFEKTTLESGNVSYSGSINYDLKLISVEEGTLLTTKNFNYGGMLNGGTGSTPDGAFASAMGTVDTDIKEFVNEHFALKGTILEISKEKKGKAEEVYIDMGSAQGLQKGQKFKIFIEADIAGEKGWKEVGELQAEKVMSANRTICKVKSAGDIVKQALGEGIPMEIKTIYKANVGDKALGIGKKMFGL